MANKLKEPFISETEKRSLSVTALANRPNDRAGQYGKRGMTPEELKAAFSALPTAIADKLNLLITEINGIIDDLNGQTAGLADADGAIKKAAVGRIEIDAELCALVFYSLSGALLYTLDIPEALVGYWCTDVNGGGEAPPTAAAVKSYADSIRTSVINEIQRNVRELDSDIGSLIHGISYNSARGILSFTDRNGSIIKDIDLPLELIVSNGYYSNGYLYLVLANGQTISISLADLLLPSWKTDIATVADSETVPPTAGAVKRYADSMLSAATEYSDGNLSVALSYADRINGEAKSYSENYANEAISAAISPTRRRLDALWKLSKGITYQFESDSDPAYSKTVPTGAKLASVKTLGGLTRKCTNLIPFPYSFTNGTTNGLTYTANSDGSVTYSGTTATQMNPYFAQGLLLPKGTYTLSGAPKGSGWNSQLLIVQTADYSTSLAEDYGNGKTFTLDADTKVNICLIVVKGATINTTVYPMLNVGSTALPYELYFEGLRSAPVTEVESAGANLGKPIANTKKAYGFTLTKNDDGSVTISGASNIAGTVILDLGETDNAHLKAGTAYSFAYYKSAETLPNVKIKITYTDANGGVYWGWSGQDTSRERQVTRLYVEKECTVGDTSPNGTYKVMLNEGSTALPYTPYIKHTLPIPAEVQALDSYGEGVNDDCYNYIDWENKQFVKRVYKALFDGTENWQYAAPEGYFVLYGGNMPAKPEANTKNALCSHYKLGDPVERNDKEFFIGTGLGIFDYICADVDAFKAYLAEQYANGTPVTLVYEVREPIITDISELLPEDNLIEVEGMGSLTLKNGHKYAVPNQIEYAVSLAEVEA